MDFDIIHRWEFRLFVVSLLVLIFERFWPWRKEQRFLRPQLLQDIFWFLFNTLGLWMLLGFTFRFMGTHFKGGLVFLFGKGVVDIDLLSDLALPVQIVVAFVLLDFVEWLTHNALHRVPVLWRFHRLHHSIHHMDWIGNFRFHPFEIYFYYLMRFVPLLLLGASKEAAAVVGTASLIIGTLNHSNLNLSYGPLRYIFNSPRMHIWHHDAQLRGKAGVNFGISLSLWDWLFTTAYMPKGESPKRIGFGGDEKFQSALWARFFVPFADIKSGVKK